MFKLMIWICCKQLDMFIQRKFIYVISTKQGDNISISRINIMHAVDFAKTTLAEIVINV